MPSLKSHTLVTLLEILESSYFIHVYIYRQTDVSENCFLTLHKENSHFADTSLIKAHEELLYLMTS